MDINGLGIAILLYVVMYLITIYLCDLDPENGDKWYHFVLMFFIWPLLTSAFLVVCCYWGIKLLFSKKEKSPSPELPRINEELIKNQYSEKLFNRCKEIYEGALLECEGYNGSNQDEIIAGAAMKENAVNRIIELIGDYYDELDKDQENYND